MKYVCDVPVMLETGVVPAGEPFEMSEGAAAHLKKKQPSFRPYNSQEKRVAIQKASQAAVETASDDPEEIPNEETSEEEEQAEEQEQPIMASYIGGGWYELEDGTKVRRNDLPENAVLAV